MGKILNKNGLFTSEIRGSETCMGCSIECGAGIVEAAAKIDIESRGTGV